jgi:hypothetical protein
VVVPVPAGVVAITITVTSASEDLSNQLRPPFGAAFFYPFPLNRRTF